MNTYTPLKFTVKQLAKHLRVSLAGAYELVKVLKTADMLDSAQEPTNRRLTWYTMRLQRPMAKRRQEDE
jgi:hypothetical protein